MIHGEVPTERGIVCGMPIGGGEEDRRQDQVRLRLVHTGSERTR